MADILTCCEGTYERHPDGWRYWWGDPVLGAVDLTISNHYDLKVVGKVVLVPASLAHNEPDLAWVLDEAGAVSQERLDRMRALDPSIAIDVMAVPLAEWDRRAAEPIGMDAPELYPPRLLDTAAVAALVGVSPATIRSYMARGAMVRSQGHLGGSAWWTRPVIDWWIAHRPGQGVGGGRPRSGGAD